MSARRIRRLLSALAVIAAVTAAPVAPGSGRKVRAEPGETAETGLELAGLTERVTYLTFENADGAELFVGLRSTYRDEIYDGDSKIGTADGEVEVVYIRPSDGHVMAKVHDLHRFQDGTVELTGLFDLNEQATLGTRIWLFATGQSGRYAGMRGIYWITIAGTGPQLSDNYYAAQLVLYRA